jgi:hypothetical protein
VRGCAGAAVRRCGGAAGARARERGREGGGSMRRGEWRWASVGEGRRAGSAGGREAAGRRRRRRRPGHIYVARSGRSGESNDIGLLD